MSKTTTFTGLNNDDMIYALYYKFILDPMITKMRENGFRLKKEYKNINELQADYADYLENGYNYWLEDYSAYINYWCRKEIIEKTRRIIDEQD